MPQTSESAMPRSPRYSSAHLSNAKRCESMRRGPTAWQACRYSCAIVPRGIRPSRIARLTLLVPTKCLGMSRFSVPITSACQSREKRRRVP